MLFENWASALFTVAGFVTILNGNDWWAVISAFGLWCHLLKLFYERVFLMKSHILIMTFPQHKNHTKQQNSDRFNSIEILRFYHFRWSFNTFPHYNRIFDYNSKTRGFWLLLKTWEKNSKICTVHLQFDIM